MSNNLTALRGVVVGRRPGAAYVKLASGQTVRVKNGLTSPPQVGARVLVAGEGSAATIVSRRR
jgi:hypothetical protein